MDALEIQALAEKISGERDERVKRQRRHMEEWESYQPGDDKWDFLKRFPGEELTPRQFEERLDAWRDGVRQRHAAQHYGVVSQYPDSKSRRNEWRLKPKKRK